MTTIDPADIELESPEQYDWPKLVDDLNALLDEDNRRAVKATLADLAVVSRTLAGRAKTIDATLASTARTDKVRRRLKRAVNGHSSH